jgi:hypothetical protein
MLRLGAGKSLLRLSANTSLPPQLRMICLLAVPLPPWRLHPPARASGPRSMVAAPDDGIAASSVDPSSTAAVGSPSASSAPAPAPPPTTPRRPPPQPHHMMTCSRTGHLRPNLRYALAVDTSTLADVPSSVRMALRDPEWCDAMRVEFDALQANRTWTLVPRPPDARVITGKWVFKNKLLPDGSLVRRKARWVVRGFNQ